MVRQKPAEWTLSISWTSAWGKVIYMPFAHSFYDLVPPDRHFESHPEFFALVSGKRRREKRATLSDKPRGLRLAVRQAEQWLGEHPGRYRSSRFRKTTAADGASAGRARQVVKEEGGAVSGLRFGL